jgi:hypothetical protein
MVAIMIDPGMHGGGGGWSTGLLFLGIGLVVLGALTYLYRKRNSKKKSCVKNYVVPGFTIFTYDPEKIDLIQVKMLAEYLDSLRDVLWPQLETLYSPRRMFLKYIHLDPEMRVKATRPDGSTFVREVVELTLPQNPAQGPTMILNPKGGQKHDAGYWFALELHNLMRYFDLGGNQIYLGDCPSDKEMRQWREAQETCMKVARNGF